MCVCVYECVCVRMYVERVKGCTWVYVCLFGSGFSNVDVDVGHLYYTCPRPDVYTHTHTHTQDFDAVDYINAKFPSEQAALEALEPFIAQVTDEIGMCVCVYVCVERIERM